MDNHSSELLFQLERASSGVRQDVVSMAATEIFWKRNYCVELLGEMISYFFNIENILAHNLTILLSSVEIIAVSWLCSVLHISIYVLMRWLAACTHKMKEYGWRYISMGGVLDKLKNDLNMIVYEPELIHEESFMMGMMDPWALKLPPFQYYLYHKLKQQKTNYFNSKSTTNAVPLKVLRKEMLSTTNQESKDSTQMLEDLGVVATTRWVQELLDPKKHTYTLMSEYSAEYLWDGLSD